MDETNRSDMGLLWSAAAHVVGDWPLEHDLTLEGDDAHHLGAARRLNLDETVTASRGDGSYRGYEVSAVERRTLQLTAIAEVMHAPEPARRALAFAPPKAERWETILRAGTELGVTDFILLRTERGVAQWHDRSQSRAMKIILEAMNQSRRCWRPRLQGPTGLSEWLASQPVGSTALADTPRYSVTAPLQTFAAVTGIIIGPEGGFSERERSLLDGCPPLVVGDGVLRTETACIVAVSTLIALQEFTKSL